MIEGTKIFIEQEPQTGDFVMRMPREALGALYVMLQAAPLESRRWFYQAKDNLERSYREQLTAAGVMNEKKQEGRVC